MVLEDTERERERGSSKMALADFLDEALMLSFICSFPLFILSFLRCSESAFGLSISSSSSPSFCCCCYEFICVGFQACQVTVLRTVGEFSFGFRKLRVAFPIMKKDRE